MIDLTQWRARIGSWYSCRIPSKHATSSKLTESLGVIGGENGGNDIVLFVFLVLLLILSGDIELNPGPKTDVWKEAPNVHDILELLADISNKWMEIGLAIGIPDSVLSGLQLSHESNILKLSRVLQSWMTTQSSSPVTWETIISAIEGPIVNDKRKADEIRQHLGFQIEQQERENTDVGAIASQESGIANSYKEALKEGKRSIAYGRIMFLGAARVGKSSLKQSLMKKKFDPNKGSTIVSEVSTVRPLYEWQTTGQGDDAWKEVTDDDELDELAQLLTAAVNDSSSSTHIESASSLYSVDHPMIDVASVSEEQIQHIEKTKVDSIFSEAIQHAFQKLNNVHTDDKNPQTFLHIWDCGGQPIFLEILPAFLTPRTMFLLMFDASKPFNKKWHSVINTEGEEMVDEEVNNTTLELLLSWMANIYSNFMVYNNGAIPEYPRMYCIGTHGDKLNDQKKKEVRDDLESHYRDKMFAPLIEDTLIVDNTTSGLENEDRNFSELRRAIYNFTSENLIVETPVSWVLFRKVIQQYDKNVIDLKEAHSIGKACKIPIDDVPKVLLFYHDLGVLLFYSHIQELKDKVFISPKWFVDILGRIFTLKERDTSTRTQQWRDLLYNKGILVQPYYHERHVWKGCEGLDPNGVMKLLILFHLAAEVCTKEWDQAFKQYFVPAVLKSFHGDPNEFPPHCHKHAVPLHIVFPTTKLTPPGFFTRLATAMASHPFCELVFEYGIYRNHITFLCCVSKIDRVILTDLHYAIQVNVLRCLPDSHSHQSFNTICQELLTVLDECMTEVKETLNHGKNFGSKTFAFPLPHHEFKFTCRNCHQSRYGLDDSEEPNSVCTSSSNSVLSESKPLIAKRFRPHYLVIPGDRPTSNLTVHCEENPNNFRPLHCSELFWFEAREDQADSYSEEMVDFPKLFEKPENEYDVLERLSYINAKWREIGLRLRVSSNDLDSLDQDRVSNEIRLAKVIRRWIEMDGQATPVNWKTIIKVVNDLDRRLAIKTYYYLKDKQNAAGSQIKQQERESTDFGPIASQKTEESRKRKLHKESSSLNSSKEKCLKGSTDTHVSMSEYTQTDKDVNVDNTFKLLVDQCGFEPSHWYELARYLQVPHEERRQIEAKKNDRIKLEDALCYWITNTDQPSWAELVKAVEKSEMTDVAIKMREALHID